MRSDMIKRTIIGEHEMRNTTNLSQGWKCTSYKREEQKFLSASCLHHWENRDSHLLATTFIQEEILPLLALDGPEKGK